MVVPKDPPPTNLAQLPLAHPLVFKRTHPSRGEPIKTIFQALDILDPQIHLFHINPWTATQYYYNMKRSFLLHAVTYNHVCVHTTELKREGNTLG